MRIVLDTNVLVSAAMTPHGRVSTIMDLVNDGRLELFVSPFILHEVNYVLARNGWEQSRIKETIELIKEVSEIVEPKVTVDVIKTDPPDNHILECAVEAKAEILVTGDRKHIRPLGTFQGIEILTPTEFLEQFFP
jgi:uncharacterized protein